MPKLKTTLTQLKLIVLYCEMDLTIKSDSSLKSSLDSLLTKSEPLPRLKSKRYLYVYPDSPKSDFSEPD